jgi:hypothetical protein
VAGRHGEWWNFIVDVAAAEGRSRGRRSNSSNIESSIVF